MLFGKIERTQLEVKLLEKKVVEQEREIRYLKTLITTLMELVNVLEGGQPCT